MVDARFLAVLGLSIVVSLALLYSTILLPVIAHKLLVQACPDHGIGEWGEAMRVVEALRPVGYVALVVTLGLVVLGLVAGRRLPALLGSLGLFTPVVGHFASTMFFLAGVAVTRMLWLPLYDASPLALRLGDVVLAPYVAVRGLLALLLGYVYGAAGPGLGGGLHGG